MLARLRTRVANRDIAQAEVDNAVEALIADATVRPRTPLQMVAEWEALRDAGVTHATMRYVEACGTSITQIRVWRKWAARLNEVQA